MRFVLLVGCLTLSAWAVVATVRLRNWKRKSVGFHRSMEMRYCAARAVAPSNRVK